MPYFFCRGAKATNICIVEQLGLAIILSSLVRTSALISGMTNFLVGSIRQAEELSTTVVPTWANFGAHSLDTVAPAEKRATSGLRDTACCRPTTVYSVPLKVIFFPIDFSEATGISSVTGKLCSARTSNITLPTIPVTPTTATFICFSVFVII